MNREQAIAKARELGQLANLALTQASDLHNAVRQLRDQREVMRAAIVQAIPRLPGDSDFAWQAKVQRAQAALDRLLNPVREFEHRAGHPLTEDDIGNAAAEIAALIQ
jgi:hypothetical protein